MSQHPGASTAIGQRPARDERVWQSQDLPMCGTMGYQLIGVSRPEGATWGRGHHHPTSRLVGHPISRGFFEVGNPLRAPGVAHRAMNCGHCRVARSVLGRDGLAIHYLYSGVQSASSRDCHSKSQEQQAMIRSLQNQQRSLRILL